MHVSTRTGLAGAASGLLLFGAALSLLLAPVEGRAALARIGEPAPAFTLPSIEGRKVSLSDFAGRYVVLEWWNSDCYAINAHYDAGAMQAAQKIARGKGAVWLTIDSTHPGHPSFVNAKQAAALLGKWKAAPSAMLQDPSGQIGRLYGAQMTPHTFVIDPKGRLIYAGAIDDQRWMRDIARANNLPLAALKEAMSGRPVTRPLTQAYG